MEQEVFSEQLGDPGFKPSPWKAALPYGLYIAIVLILVSVVLYATGTMMATWAGWLTFALLFGGVIFAQLSYRTALGGYMNYGQAVGIAVIAMLYASVLVSLFTFILYKFIDPGLLEQISIATEEKLVEKGIPQEQMDMTLQMMKKFQSPGIIAISGILQTALTGLVFGLIAAIFTQKKSPDTIFE